MLLLGEGFDHADSGDVLAHDADDGVKVGLHDVVERDAFPGDEYDGNQKDGRKYEQYGGQTGIHGQGDQNASEQKDWSPDCDGLDHLDEGLDVV